ncbi:MFS transporter [Rhodococcus opacus]|uniref:MFS transporter n=1 Tax=Rhodococcus opacus TaxID=37919 RepID=UPI001F582706|nr:MFS transporter [Rhodococcus opacus]UNN04930.1 MFS transporter [Rhodococcus opacus]
MTKTVQLAQEGTATLWHRLGLPRPLLLGYLGLLLFMIGDGVESNYLAPFLRDHNGLDTERVGLLVSLYGIVVAFAAWLSAALSDLWGPRRVMAIGFAAWVIFEVIFLTLGVAGDNEAVLFVSYALRGLGYPLFAFGFLVWIAAVADRRRLATAIGWFYVMFTAGLPTLGALVANGAIPLLGGLNTLWLSVGLVVIGGLLALFGVKEQIGRSRLAEPDAKPFAILFLGLRLITTRPQVLSAAIIRTINTAPQYGSFVFFPALFAEQFGFGLSRWLLLTTIIYAANIPFNVVFGMIGDRLGWVRTVRWFGAVGSGVSLLALYYLPVWTGSYALAILAGVAFGISLAGFVPLSAITAALEPSHPGAVMSAYNIGMGASVAVGPLLVAAFLGTVGAEGMVWIFAGMYALAALLTLVFPANGARFSTSDTTPTHPTRSSAH